MKRALGLITVLLVFGIQTAIAACPASKNPDSADTVDETKIPIIVKDKGAVKAVASETWYVSEGETAWQNGVDKSADYQLNMAEWLNFKSFGLCVRERTDDTPGTELYLRFKLAEFMMTAFDQEDKVSTFLGTDGLENLPLPADFRGSMVIHIADASFPSPVYSIVIQLDLDEGGTFNDLEAPDNSYPKSITVWESNEELASSKDFDSYAFSTATSSQVADITGESCEGREDDSEQENGPGQGEEGQGGPQDDGPPSILEQDVEDFVACMGLSGGWASATGITADTKVKVSLETVRGTFETESLNAAAVERVDGLSRGQSRQIRAARLSDNAKKFRQRGNSNSKKSKGNKKSPKKSKKEKKSKKKR